jgi:hypothetical protein
MENITLDEKTCTDILVNSLEVGQRKGSFSIKDASVMHKVILFLRKDIKPKEHPDLDKTTSYDTLIRGIVLANSKGSYTIDEAALIDSVITKLQELNLASKQPTEKESKGKEPEEKIKEI